jgi:hypothetical protein
MIETVVGSLSNPLYLLIVAVGVLTVLRRRHRGVVSAPETAAAVVAEEDPQWIQAQATILQALGALGFQRDHDVDGGSRLQMEREDLTVSVSWDSRRRRVSARISESLEGRGVGARDPEAVGRQGLFTCQLPRAGKADGAIAHLTAQLQARTASPGV